MQGLDEQPRSLWRRSPLEMGIMAAVFLVFLIFSVTLIPSAPHDIPTNFCPQSKSLVPDFDRLDLKSTAELFIENEEYFNFSLSALQGAVQVPTQSYDDMDLDPTKDSRFEIFTELHAHFARTFPLAWQFVEKVNTYGLLFTFQGANSKLKPVVLMAHQDVVPVNPDTIDQWTYPPFDADFDGEWLYGRGACDTKNTVVAILESVEALLAQNWQPERTLLVSFGFDEEISGKRGAWEIAQTLEKRYGADSIEIIVDEGFGAIEEHGAKIALPVNAEKGYVDAHISLLTPGGHSSMPPDHTGIGIISDLITELEDNPFPASLDNTNPTLTQYRCVAENAPKIGKDLKRTILDIDHGDHRQQLINYIESQPSQKYLIRTSQAVDTIVGGVKINALPEQVDVAINHRIALDSSLAAIYERIESYTQEISQRYNLGLISNGEILIEPTAQGYFNVSFSGDLEPAPISPTIGPVWDLLAGTIIHSMEAFTDLPVIVAPSVFPANTDTRHYWNLTRSIYRFAPIWIEDMLDYHTVNERLRFRSHILAVTWFYEFIINTTT